ncbi:MAG: hypothetical protein EBT63_06960 [Proteobacteria bacterium]|nr:hypothetical protein [Pseudomonadota bacterium]
MKKIFINNASHYFRLLLLSFCCVLIHAFWCNFGGLYKYFLSQNNKLLETSLDTILCVVILSLALALLFSLNIFLTRIFIFLANFIGAVYTYFALHLGIIINEQIMISALFYAEENDISSSFDYWVFIYTIFLMAVSTFVILGLEKKLKIKSRYSFNKNQLIEILKNNFTRLTISVIFILLFLAPIHKNVFVITYKLKTFAEQMMPSYLMAQYKEIKLMHKSSKKIELKGYENYGFELQKSGNETAPTIAVIVIGESLRSDRLSINGYARDTTPKMQKIKNLFSFKDVLTCATSTSASLLCMLTDEKQDEWMPKFASSTNEKKYSVAKVLKDVGFDITVLSTANKDSGIYIYKDFHAPDKIIMASELRKKYMSELNDFGDLLLLQEIKTDVTKNSLYVLGTRGSHREYYGNYTRDFAKFQPDIGHSLEQIANSYDNTIVYFDNFMNELVNKLKDSNAIIFYASDHGESLGEGDVFLHGAPLETAPREQRRVPMIIWMSDKFIKSNQKNYANLKKANELNRAEKLEVKHDHFFHTIIGCLGINPTKKIENSDLNLCNISATK